MTEYEDYLIDQSMKGLNLTTMVRLDAVQEINFKKELTMMKTYDRIRGIPSKITCERNTEVLGF